MPAIQSFYDLQSGDILICSQKDAPARMLVNLGQLLLRDHYRDGEFSAGHAGVVVGNGDEKFLVEAMPSGARVRKLNSISDWSPKHRYYRLPEDYSGQAEQAAAIAVAMLGTPYSFMSYAYLGAYLGGFQPEWLELHIDRRKLTEVKSYSATPFHVRSPIEAICSVLAEQSWTLAGKKVIHGTRPQVVTPGMLCRQLEANPDVIRTDFGFA
jgi:hypothetical protein